MTFVSISRDQEFVLGCALDGAWRQAALAAVADLGLPDGWIGAGFLRTPVWDRLHGKSTATPLDDLDVVFFDPSNLDPATEARLEARLRAAQPGLNWQVRNQARMHLRNGDRPYRSTADALCHWLETPTAVALRLVANEPELLAPFGLTDLVNLRLRPTPHGRMHRLQAYRARVRTKDWLERWPRLTVDWG